MNLFFKSSNVYSFFLLGFIMKASLLLGHNDVSRWNFSPSVFSYPLPQIYNNAPNTSFYKNENGVIFIGKENGILSIYNDKFYFTSTKFPIILEGDSRGKVYYTTRNDFGQITFNEVSGTTINSFKDRIPTQHSYFDPYNIISLNEVTFIATTEGVIVNDCSSIHYKFFNRQACKLYKAKNNIFLFVEKEGLYIWRNKTFDLVAYSHTLGDKFPNGIIYDNKGFDILIENKIYRYLPDNLRITPKPSVNSKYINLSHYLSLSESTSIFSNKDNELFLIDEKSQISTRILPLPSSKIQSLFIDSFNDLWLTYDFSIYKIEYPSLFSVMNLKDMIPGTVLSSAISNNTIYIGTNQNLISLETDNNIEWEKTVLVKKENEYFHIIKQVEQTTIAASNKGLYEILNNKINQFDRGNYSFLFMQNEEKIIACNTSGLFLFEKKNNKWNKKNLDKSITFIQSGAQYKNNIALLAPNQKLWLYNFTSGEITEINHSFPFKLEKLVVLENKLHILGEKSSWQLNNLNEFIDVSQDPEISEFQNYNLKVCSDNNAWYTKKDSENSYSVIKIIPNNNESRKISVPGRPIEQLICFDETPGKLWITERSNLICLDLTHNDTPPISDFHTNIYLSKFSKNSPPLKASNYQTVHHANNDLTIKLFDRRYQINPSPNYRYKLTHYQEEWSNWAQKKTIKIENLWERDYQLTIQSISGSGKISEPFVFNFTILAPIHRTWYAYLTYAILLLFLIFLIYKGQLLRLKKVESKVELRIKERTDSILKEKEKSDKLVADMFPKGTAEELKSKGRAKSEKFKKATVLFSDIQGFTKIAEEMNPDVLIDELDKFFFHFDSVVEKYNIEKIKTIGDAYMAAGGIPIKNSSNPVEVVLAGLEMQNYMKELKKLKTDIWDLRIGVHTGPVIAGVVGHKKLSYDIWGDTVNTASRMESSGEIGKVNISGNTYALVKDYFICEYRGKLPVKYKGNIDMYFVTGLRPELSIDLQGMPNKRFYIKLQLLKLQDIEQRVFEQILIDVQLTLHFHNQEFIRRVINQAELLGRSENISDEEQLMVQTAALLLFTGLYDSYDNFENRSAILAREILPEFSYSEKQIDKISNLILSTKQPFQPQNRLESILIDAKMEYLGRADFVTMLKLLFLEEKNSSKESSQERLIKKHKSLLKNFTYFTVAGQRLREIDGEKQIINLESWK